MVFGFFVLLTLAGGTASPTHDLVSLLRADDYFKARGIAVEPDRMVKLAGTDPKDGKAQVQQLLAIRWLGENPAQPKKAAGARALLGDIAAGKKGQDPQGFARLYARQALARLDGKTLPVAATAPRNSIPEALAWFPADVTMGGGVELRPPSTTVPAGKDPVREMLSRVVPAREREEVYKVAEAIGNVRIDRAVLAFEVKDRGGPGQAGALERIYVRLTGAVNREWLADYLHRQLPGAARKDEKGGPRGEAITLISSRRYPRALAIIEDNELVLAGHESNKPNHLEVVEKVLQVRAGKEKGVSGGPLAGLLKDVPVNARSLAAGQLSEGMRKQMVGGAGPFAAAPQSFVVYLTRGEGDITKASLRLHARAAMKDAGQAKAFAKAVEDLKQKGLKELDKVPPGSAVPPDVIRAARETLKGLRVEAKGSSARAELPLPEEKILVEGLPLWLGWSDEERGQLKPAPPEKPR